MVASNFSRNLVVSSVSHTSTTSMLSGLRDSIGGGVKHTTLFGDLDQYHRPHPSQRVMLSIYLKPMV